VKLGGRVDALVFAGGIGERSVEVRRRVGERVGCLGFEVGDGRGRGNGREDGKGEGEGVVWEIGAEKESGAGKMVLVCETDEQFEMARQCAGDMV